MIDFKKLKEDIEQDAVFASLDGGFSDTYLNGALKTLEKVEKELSQKPENNKGRIFYTQSPCGKLKKNYL